MPKAKAPEVVGQLRLQEARSHIKLKHPYFYVTLLGLIPKDVPGIGTLFVTDTMVLGIDMAWFSTLDVEVAAGCLIHEVMHILRDMTRVAAMEDRDLAGRAFDIPINDDLKKFGIKLPPWAIYSDTYGLKPGLSGEGYYHLLKDLPPPPSGCKIGSGNCGSCNGGKDPTDSKDEPGRTTKEVQYFKKVGAQAIREFVKSKNMKPGDIPGMWQELLEFEKEKPIVPWQSIVRASAGRAFSNIAHGHTDYSLRRPAKRSYVVGLLRPGLIDYKPVVALIEDSSASMGHEQLKENRVELVSAMQQLGLEEVWFLNADVKVQTRPKKINVRDVLKLPVTGRGGTDFRPAISIAMSLRPKPDLIFYSTDGDGRAPERKPSNTEFIWLLAPGPWTRSPCNWGTQILTTNDPSERKKYTILHP